MTADHPGRGTPASLPSIDDPGSVAPSKPSQPQAFTRPAVPSPVEIDLDRSPEPRAFPPAAEILPEPRSPFDVEPDEALSASAPLSDLERLGRGAAANAALSAAGAPTPLGGVPVVLDARASRPAAPADAERPSAASSPFMPVFAPVNGPAAPAVPAAPATAPRAAAAVATADGPGEPDEDMPDGHEASPLAGAPVPQSEPTLYRPRVAPGQPPADDPRGTRDGDDDGTDAAPADERNPGRAWPLILIGLVVMAGIAAAILWTLRAENIELPPQQIVAEPTGRVIEPITPEDPTPFLAALPTTAGEWAMTAALTNDALADQALPSRVAESHTLTYSDGTTEATVVARQLYSSDDAHDALVRAAGKKAELTEATVGDTVVGERAESLEDGTLTIMWTNGSAYFEASGPEASVRELVSLLGL